MRRILLLTAIILMSLSTAATAAEDFDGGIDLTRRWIPSEDSPGKPPANPRMCPKYPRYVCQAVSAFVNYAREIQYTEPFELREQLLNAAVKTLEDNLIVYDCFCNNDSAELYVKYRHIWGYSRTLLEKRTNPIHDQAAIAKQTRDFQELSDELINMCDKNGAESVYLYHPKWTTLRIDTTGYGIYRIAPEMEQMKKVNPNQYEKDLRKGTANGYILELSASTEVLPSGRQDGVFSEVFIRSNHRRLLVPMKALTASGIATPDIIVDDFTK